MINFTVAIDGAGLQDLIDKLEPRAIRAPLRSGMYRGLLIIHGRLPPYPPAPPNSTYIRTGTLGRSISERVQDTEDGIVGLIGTNVTRQSSSSGYAEYVIGGPAEQAWMHEGRWWQLPDEVEKNVGVVAEQLEQALEDALR